MAVPFLKMFLEYEPDEPQRAALEQAGLPAQVLRTPRALQEQGCGYCCLLYTSKQSCLSLATSIPTQTMRIPPMCLFDADSTELFTLVALFHINRLAVSN